jgi:hypothetical protein
VCIKRKTRGKKREREEEMGERPIPLSNICFGIIRTLTSRTKKFFFGGGELHFRRVNIVTESKY